MEETKLEKPSLARPHVVIYCYNAHYRIQAFAEYIEAENTYHALISRIQRDPREPQAEVYLCMLLAVYE